MSKRTTDKHTTSTASNEAAVAATYSSASDKADAAPSSPTNPIKASDTSKAGKARNTNKAGDANTAGKAAVARRKLRKAALYGAIALVLGTGMVVGGAVLCAPDMSKYEQRSHTLYDRGGNIIYTSLSEGDYLRIKTDADQVDPLYIKMLLSSEDERFYSHLGVDPIAAVRALVSNVASLKRVSGASTLAMQVCRMLEPKERTLLSKIKEAFGALYITHVYGRDEILNMYLTLAPFGSNIEGVTAASYSYFNHGPEHLTPAEAALLVAMPRSPEVMRPDRRPKVAKFYRNEVLKKAVADGIIRQDILKTATEEHIHGVRFKLSQSAYYLGQSIFKGTLRTPDLITAATAAQPAPTAPTSSGGASGVAAEGATGAPAAAYSTGDASAMIAALGDGMRVALPREMVSSIDAEIQQALLEAVDAYAKTYVSAEKQDNIAVIAVDNKTFEVKGYVGGVSPDLSFVDAAQAIRSPGSALKPFVYGMAFEKGMLHPNTILLDTARLYRTYQPRNFDRLFFGEITAAMALQASLNLPALDIMTAIAPVKFITRINEQKNTLPFDRGTVYPPLTTREYSVIVTNPQHEDNATTAAAGGSATDSDAAAALAAEAETTANAAEADTTTNKAAGAAPYVVQADSQDAELTQLMHERAAYAYPAGRLILPSNAKPDISIALGGTGIALFDLTQLFAALANDGEIKPLRLTPLKDGKSHNASAEISGRVMEKDAARAVYRVLEGTMEPLGFYSEDKKISYKTGTSFKSRDAWAVGSFNNITVGVWIGRNNGRPTDGYTGYSNAAPVLFSVFNSIKTRPREDLERLDSVLLRLTPPVALRSIEIKEIGRVQKRRTTAPSPSATTLSDQRQRNAATTMPASASADAAGAGASDAVAGSEAQSLALSKSHQNADPISIVFPIDNSRMNVGFSKRIMVQFKGGVGPYYMLINDEVHDSLDFFEPEHDGLHNITVIDSNGKSASVQVFIQGVDKKKQ